MTAAPAAAGRSTTMRPEHAEQVLSIYQLGIDEGNTTFETTAPNWKSFDAAKPAEHRLVALDEQQRLLGWAAVIPVSDRLATPAWSSTPWCAARARCSLCSAASPSPPRSDCPPSRRWPSQQDSAP